MKKIILLTAMYLLACHSSVHAQTLFGTTAAGGNKGGGTINKFDAGSNTLTVIKNFESIADGSTYPPLTGGRDGKLYGVASNGGLNNYGFIFSFNPVTLEYSTLKNFDKINGANPNGSLVQASNGTFYGTTSFGGSANNGVIYSFDPATRKLTKLKDFEFAEIRRPSGMLIQASDGKLYGMTLALMTIESGIFSYEPSTSTYTHLVNLGPGGYDLIQANDGKLYCTTAVGGSNDAGAIFSFDPTSQVLSKVKDFLIWDGKNPSGAMIQGKDNKLYGTTSSGGVNNLGVIYSYDPASSAFTKLKDFDIPGSYPGSLLQSSDDHLYGVTGPGGDQTGIFSFDLSSSTITPVIQFDGRNGNYPVYNFTNGNDGKLYGITSRLENTSVDGLIFSLDLSNSTYLLVKDLRIAPDGSNVTGALLQTNNNLYGMTTHGGTKGYGVIFSLDPASNLYTKLYDFDLINGANPLGNLMQASNGILYGMTEIGGVNKKGVLFSFDIASSAYTKLKDFSFTDGTFPNGGLIQASDGKLYGMTKNGGSQTNGVIFSFDPETTIFTNKGDFGSGISETLPGGIPYGNLMQASNEKLYGMTTVADKDFKGSIFSYDILSSGYNSIATLGSFAYVPYGNLIQGQDGKLYGTAASRDVDGGVIFSIDSLDPSSPLQITVLKDLNSADGSQPLGSLLQASNGKLYGMTYKGGSTDQGVIFSVESSTGNFIKLQDFNGANGAYPYYGSSFIEVGPVPENSPPVLASIGNQSVNEKEPFHFTATGVDSDMPADILSFAIATVATGKFPAGAHIDLHTGLFSWTASESQGPGEYRVRFIVFDGTAAAEEDIVINVNEINSPPLLAAVADQHVDDTGTLNFSAIGTDEDLPSNPMTFSLAQADTGKFPDGATINPSDGTFKWSPLKEQIPGIYKVRIVVSDGLLTDEEDIQITVRKTGSEIFLASYPNPSAKLSTIIFSTPANENNVTLEVFDTRGRRMRQLYNGKTAAFEPYEFKFDGSMLSPGLYLLRLTTSKKAAMFRMILAE
jgi:uncharacterized repeat protein (TIGR03803 family)